MDFFQLPMSGLELPLSEMEQMVQDNAHHFAETVMRPAGALLDRCSADEVVAPDSPLWEVMKKSEALGLSVSAMAELPPLDRVKLFSIASEELAWGDAGLAGNAAMVELCEGKRGCWGITEPDHGADMLDASRALAQPGTPYGRPGCVARIDGDKIIVNGQKSAWVSNGITAEVCALYCHIEENGQSRHGVALIVPLDLPGVSRGKPLEKLGFRALNQGELYFDNVEVPISHLLAGPDNYKDFIYRTLCEANPHVGALAVGVARAAFRACSGLRP